MQGPRAWGKEGFRLTPWQLLQSRYTILKYKSREDLERFHTGIRFGPAKWNRSLELEVITEVQLEDMVRKKMDAIFARAAEILARYVDTHLERSFSNN